MPNYIILEVVALLSGLRLAFLLLTKECKIWKLLEVELCEGSKMILLEQYNPLALGKPSRNTKLDACDLANHLFEWNSK